MESKDSLPGAVEKDTKGSLRNAIECVLEITFRAHARADWHGILRYAQDDT